jgi:hypothetical protein
MEEASPRWLLIFDGVMDTQKQNSPVEPGKQGL